INKFDFIDAIVRWADPRRFRVGVCVGTERSNIARPEYPAGTPRWVVPWGSRRGIPAAAWRLSRVLRSWGVDILHTHHYEEAIIGLISTRLYPRTRLVIGRHYSDAIYRSARGWRREA